MPRCFQCKKDIAFLNSLWNHVKIVHRFDSTTRIRCGESECFRYFPNIKSFRRHWNIEHASNQLPIVAEKF